MIIGHARRVSVWLAVAAGVLLGGPGEVSAHAQLLTISPADGEVVDVAPEAVVLTFNEPVSLTGGAVRVLDDAATQVSEAAVQSGVTITAALSDGLAGGTYTVTWEVVSADSHRITGASVFHVGAATSGGLDQSELGSGDDVAWAIRLGAVTLSWVGYAGALLASGALWFSIFIDRQSRQGELDEGQVPLGSLIVRAALLGAVALVAALPFRIARVGGGLDTLRDNEVLMSELRGPIGLAGAVTVVSLLVVAIVVEQRWASWIAGVAALTALAGFTLEGHTRAYRRSVMIGSDVVHLVAAAIWLGGIMALAVAFRTSIAPQRLAILVRRYSGTALVAAVIVAVTGVTMAWIILPGSAEITSTGYGLALVAKVLLVVVVVALGALNRWWLVPAVGPEDATADRERTAPARRRLSRIVGAELVILLAVVGVTAVLVTRSPVASSSAPASPPTVTVPDRYELELADGAGIVEVSISPSRAGTNLVDLVLLDTAGRIVNPVQAPVVEFTLPALEIGPLRPDVSPLAIGRYELAADLGFAGEWELVVRVRVSDFESASASGTIVIE